MAVALNILIVSFAVFFDFLLIVYWARGFEFVEAGKDAAVSAFAGALCLVSLSYAFGAVG